MRTYQGRWTGHLSEARELLVSSGQCKLSGNRIMESRFWSQSQESCGASSVRTVEGRDPTRHLEVQVQHKRMKPSEWTQSAVLPTTCPAGRHTRLQPESVPAPCVLSGRMKGNLSIKFLSALQSSLVGLSQWNRQGLIFHDKL